MTVQTRRAVELSAQSTEFRKSYRCFRLLHVELMSKDYPLCKSCSEPETRYFTVVEAFGHNVLHTLPVDEP